MCDEYTETPEFRTVLAIAEALRREFGVEIDAHPGGVGNEPGVVNRAYRAATGCILGTVSRGDDVSTLLTWALRQAALRRLVEFGVDGTRAEGLLDEEPGFGDAWFAYLTLAPESVIEDVLGDYSGT